MYSLLGWYISFSCLKIIMSSFKKMFIGDFLDFDHKLNKCLLFIARFETEALQHVFFQIVKVFCFYFFYCFAFCLLF